MMPSLTGSSLFSFSECVYPSIPIQTAVKTKLTRKPKIKTKKAPYVNLYEFFGNWRFTIKQQTLMSKKLKCFFQECRQRLQQFKGYKLSCWKTWEISSKHSWLSARPPSLIHRGEYDLIMHKHVCINSVGKYTDRHILDHTASMREFSPQP